MASEAQPLLFDSLPETESSRRKPRRVRAVPEPVVVETVSEPVVMAPPPPPPPPPPAPQAAALDPAALTNPELRALVRALPDLRLSYLLVEAARELKHRVLPGQADEDGEAGEPNPALLRAARQVVGELSGEDD
ncbi:MAG TPA: hypothetical protein VD978_09155 [Azospirillum sp.]|nr:hypothetical protein [Azospirillum sp.]